MRVRLLALSLPFVALVAAASAAGQAPRSTVTVKVSSFGRILFDGRGYALYVWRVVRPSGRLVS